MNINVSKYKLAKELTKRILSVYDEIVQKTTKRDMVIGR